MTNPLRLWKTQWILFSSLLTLTFAFSHPSTVDAAGASGKAEILFSQAMLSLEAQDFVQTKKLLAEALQNNPDHAAAHFFMGLVEFRQNNCTKAAPSLEKSIQLDPSLGEAYLYQGLCYYRIGPKEKSLPSFKKAEELLPQGEAYHDLARSYRRNLEGETSEAVAADKPATADRKWYLYSSLSSQYDSNVTLDPSNITIATLPSDQSDFLWSGRLGAGLKFYQNRTTQLFAEASYFQSLYAELNDFNYGLAHAEVRSYSRFGDRNQFILLIPASYDFSILQTSKYLQTGAVSPLFGYELAPWITLQVQQRNRYDGFFQAVTTASQERDAWNLQTEPAVFLRWKQRSLRLSYILEENLAQGNDWDYHAHTIGLTLYSPLVWDVQMYLNAYYMPSKVFENVDSILSQQRKDHGQSYGAAISRKIDFVPGLSASINYNFQKNESNIAFFEYVRHITGVTFAYRY